MKIGDEVYVHGYVDEIRKDVVVIRNEGGYFGTVPGEVANHPEPQWIPVERGLPEPRTAVLGYAPKYGNIFAVYYDSVYGWHIWSPTRDEYFPNSQGEITAWMPLPEPYKEGREENDK